MECASASPKWHKVDSVPEEYADWFNKADVTYFITRKDAAGTRGYLEALASESTAFAMAEDLSLRGYYIFVKEVK